MEEAFGHVEASGFWVLGSEAPDRAVCVSCSAGQPRALHSKALNPKPSSQLRALNPKR